MNVFRKKKQKQKQATIKQQKRFHRPLVCVLLYILTYIFIKDDFNF